MNRHGITLLELLLTSAMLIVLLGIAWNATLFTTRVEMKREQQTKTQRLIRNWTQMLNNDFRSAIQDTEQLNKAEGNETIRHFGVSGTATQLRIDVSDYSQRSEGSSELRTIFYDFRQPGGLVRQERDHTASESAPGFLQAAPEVTGGQFRYFDGGAWHEYWSSLDQKSVPSAIEVMFYLSFSNGSSTGSIEQHRVIVQIPAASQMFSESYRRATPPSKPVNNAATPQSLPPTPQPSPPSSPSHSFFGDG